LNNEQALDKFRDFGSAVRPALILTVCLVGGVAIGKYNDAPVEGLAGGLISAAIINGILNCNDSTQTVS